MIKLLKLVDKIKKTFPKQDEKTEEEFIVEEIKKALNELENAEIYFQNITEAELIDYAIYKMDAALEKYTYLIKLAKEKEVKSKWKIMK